MMWYPLQGRTHPIQDAMHLLLKCVPLRVTSLYNVNSSLWYWVQAEAASCPLRATPLQNARPHEDPWKPWLTHYPLGATTHLWKHCGFLWHSVDTKYLFLRQRPSQGRVSIFHISVFVLIKGFPLQTEFDCSLLPGPCSQWGDRGGGPLDLSIIGSVRCWRGGAKAPAGSG